MKIQELAIIFIIIILPISILLSEYTQFQIQTLNTQTLYDSRLTAATYDAIKAFQIETENDAFDLNDRKLNSLNRSVNKFRSSIQTSFELTGYTEEELNNYIPALVYTLYDGFYLYSPYLNVNYKDDDENNGEMMYGLKPYINYSCRYIMNNIDVVITYSLDNYITVRGQIGGEYVNKSGYLIDNIEIVNGTTVKYNNIIIDTEELKEEILIGDNLEQHSYIKVAGTKYYIVGDEIKYYGMGELKRQTKNGNPMYEKYVHAIENNAAAIQYYKEAAEFTKWFKNDTELDELTYANAYDEVINEDGTTSYEQIWSGKNDRIFDFNVGFNISNNIENELSNFNQHRLAVIRHKIETNLAVAIANYNEYSNVENIFHLPQIKEDEWEQITHNICLISFLQGLSMKGKMYNGYTLVTNSESEEVVLEENIYILGDDNYYHKVNDLGFKNGAVNVDIGDYGETVGSAGRLNLDFSRVGIMNTAGNIYYYYPLKNYNASYNSLVMQDNIETYDDIYDYVNSQSEDLRVAFYTALGRERYGLFKAGRGADDLINILAEY